MNIKTLSNHIIANHKSYKFKSASIEFDSDSEIQLTLTNNNAKYFVILINLSDRIYVSGYVSEIYDDDLNEYISNFIEDEEFNSWSLDLNYDDNVNDAFDEIVNHLNIDVTNTVIKSLNKLRKILDSVTNNFEEYNETKMLSNFLSSYAYSIQ